MKFTTSTKRTIPNFKYPNLSQSIKTDRGYTMAFISRLCYEQEFKVKEVLTTLEAKLVLYCNYDSSTFIVVDIGEVRVIGFCGTNGDTKDYKRNINFFKTNFCGIYAHKGFVMSLEDILKYVLVYTRTDREIIYTGHSSGGALALLLNVHTKANEIYVYGCPNIASGHKFKSHYTHTAVFQYTIIGDIVPFLPPCFIGYDKPSTSVYLGGATTLVNPVISHRINSYINLL